MAKKQSRMELLNQYTSRTVPGFVNVLGTATNTATVSLWRQDNLALYTPPTRQGDYFRGEMLVNNNTGALWLTPWAACDAPGSRSAVGAASM